MNFDPPIRPRVKTEVEMLKRLRELIQRSKKRYIKNHLKPRGTNCRFVVYDEDMETNVCTKCGTTDPDRCLNHSLFQPTFTRDQLAAKFGEDIKNPQILLRDFRAEAAIMWCLGMFGEGEE